MVGHDEGIEFGVPSPPKWLPPWSSDKPLPEKKKNCVQGTNQNDGKDHDDEHYVLSFIILPSGSHTLTFDPFGYSRMANESTREVWYTKAE